MKVVKWLLGVVAVLVGVAAVLVGPDLYKTASEDPTVWESDIAELTRRAKSVTPAPDAPVVFVGSSSIRMWDDLAADMEPLPVVQMGFGGGKIGDVLHYLQPLVLDYPARAIVMYIGGNDLMGLLGPGKEPEEVVAVYDQIVERIRAERPDVPIYYVAVKPTTTAAASRPRGAAVNRLIAARAEADPSLHFIDANPAVTLPDGSADPDMLLWDGIHLSRDGYVAWGKPIRDRLVRDLQ